MSALCDTVNFSWFKIPGRYYLSMNCVHFKIQSYIQHSSVLVYRSGIWGFACWFLVWNIIFDCQIILLIIYSKLTHLLTIIYIDYPVKNFQKLCCRTALAGQVKDQKHFFPLGGFAAQEYCTTYHNQSCNSTTISSS